jgi:hypothetical protein
MVPVRKDNQTYTNLLSPLTIITSSERKYVIVVLGRNKNSADSQCQLVSQISVTAAVSRRV